MKWGEGRRYRGLGGFEGWEVSSFGGAKRELIESTKITKVNENRNDLMELTVLQKCDC
jgi:hypothetical protein